MKLTAALLASALEIPSARAEKWIQPIADTCTNYVIDTPLRLAAFLAQIGHESDRLAFVREIWGPTAAQKGYEGRQDLGNTHPGDGRLFLGRGLIMRTGRGGYAEARESLRAQGFKNVPDFEREPEALEIPHWAALTSGDYWRTRNLNTLADIGDTMRITRRVNGGLNGLKQRVAIYGVALKVLQAA